MVNIHASPPGGRQDNLQSMRGSVLGQMHQGQIQAAATRPMLRFSLRVAIFLNITSWVGLWISFQFKNFFPPHDAPFMSAIGWYFFFGAALCFLAVIVSSYARKVETAAVIRALTNKRSYAWHSQHGTQSTHEGGNGPSAVAAPINSMGPAAPVSSAVGAGAGQYRFAGWLVLISLVMWTVGMRAVIANLF